MASTSEKRKSSTFPTPDPRRSKRVAPLPVDLRRRTTHSRRVSKWVWPVSSNEQYGPRLEEISHPLVHEDGSVDQVIRVASGDLYLSSLFHQRDVFPDDPAVDASAVMPFNGGVHFKRGGSVEVMPVNLNPGQLGWLGWWRLSRKVANGPDDPWTASIKPPEDLEDVVLVRSVSWATAGNIGAIHQDRGVLDGDGGWLTYQNAWSADCSGRMLGTALLCTGYLPNFFALYRTFLRHDGSDPDAPSASLLSDAPHGEPNPNGGVYNREDVARTADRMWVWPFERGEDGDRFFPRRERLDHPLYPTGGPVFLPESNAAVYGSSQQQIETWFISEAPRLPPTQRDGGKQPIRLVQAPDEPVTDLERLDPSLLAGFRYPDLSELSAVDTLPDPWTADGNHKALLLGARNTTEAFGYMRYDRYLRRSLHMWRKLIMLSKRLQEHDSFDLHTATLFQALVTVHALARWFGMYFFGLTASDFTLTYRGAPPPDVPGTRPRVPQHAVRAVLLGTSPAKEARRQPSLKAPVELYILSDGSAYLLPWCPVIPCVNNFSRSVWLKPGPEARDVLHALFDRSGPYTPEQALDLIAMPSLPTDLLPVPVPVPVPNPPSTPGSGEHPLHHDDPEVMDLFLRHGGDVAAMPAMRCHAVLSAGPVALMFPLHRHEPSPWYLSPRVDEMGRIIDKKGTPTLRSWAVERLGFNRQEFSSIRRVAFGFQEHASLGGRPLHPKFFMPLEVLSDAPFSRLPIRSYLSPTGERALVLPALSVGTGTPIGDDGDDRKGPVRWRNLVARERIKSARTRDNIEVEPDLYTRLLETDRQRGRSPVPFEKLNDDARTPYKYTWGNEGWSNFVLDFMAILAESHSRHDHIDRRFSQMRTLMETRDKDERRHVPGAEGRWPFQLPDAADPHLFRLMFHPDYYHTPATPREVSVYTEVDVADYDVVEVHDLSVSPYDRIRDYVNHEVTPCEPN